MNGYLDFYKKIYNHHRLPFYVVSLWTANLLFVQTLIGHIFRDKFERQCLEGAAFTPSNSLLCLISVEMAVLLVINFNYISKLLIIGPLLLRITLRVRIHLHGWCVICCSEGESVQQAGAAAGCSTRRMDSVFNKRGLFCSKRVGLSSKCRQSEWFYWKTVWLDPLFEGAQQPAEREGDAVECPGADVQREAINKSAYTHLIVMYLYIYI